MTNISRRLNSVLQFCLSHSKTVILTQQSPNNDQNLMTQNTRHVCCVCVFPYLTSFCACCIFHGVSIISTHQNQCNSSFCGPLDAVHKDPMVCNSADPKVAGTSSYGHAACFQIRSAPSRVIKHLTCGQSIGFYFNIHMSVIRT